MSCEYTFKTYIASGQEHYEYSTDVLAKKFGQHKHLTVIKKDFPFPESLLTLLYLDTDPIDLLVKRADRAIREFLPTKDERYVTEAFAAIDELAGIHVYFELIRLEWRWRFAVLRANGYEDCSEWLLRKRLTRIPAYLDEAQRQILSLFDYALNMDGEKKTMAERAAPIKQHRNDFWETA